MSADPPYIFLNRVSRTGHSSNPIARSSHRKDFAVTAAAAPAPTARKPKVVIIGAGFGGLSAAKALANVDVDIKLIDRRNYHLFQPLLYQVATADLSPADVAWPIRGIFSHQPNVSVALSEVQSIDRDAKVVHCDNVAFDYDYLIVATGSQHSYFGNEQWEPYAPGLKRVIDATEIRKRVLMAFEHAEVCKDSAEQDRNLTFVVVGGGPTGVEMAGAIAELARHTLARDFRTISPKDARIILIEAGDRVLAPFPEKLSQKARRSLEKLGVEVHTGQRVLDIDDDGVKTAEGEIPTATVVWGAGVKVVGPGTWLDVDTDRSGKIPVEPDMSLPGHEDVFVIGDAAKIAWRDGRDVPGIAPAAKQEGKYVARMIKRDLKGRARGKGFKYRHMGNLATIGRHAAVIDLGKVRMSGPLAWWLWGIAHLYFLIGVRRPVFVAMSWFWSYLTYSKGARLITGLRSGPPTRPEPEQPQLFSVPADPPERRAS
ncbi:MAG: NAD(P)/FAD-dependent oxidoreductase [Pseudomonadota bacterium]